MVISSNYGYRRRVVNDEYNLSKQRRQCNTNYESYNCGGFALGTFSWYFPCDVDILDFALLHNLITPEIYTEIYTSTDEEEYEIALEDEMNRWYDMGYLSVPKNSMDGFATFEAWRAMEIADQLEYYLGDIWTGNTPFMEYFISKILGDIQGIRIINDLSDLKDNEYCVAFRVGGGDYHYIRSNNNKCTKWIGKCGRNPVTQIIVDKRYKGEAFFDAMFGRRYNSDTIFFAKTV